MTQRNSTAGLSLMELYVIDADGTHLSRLTTTTGVDSAGVNAFPAWSPDSRHIAFIRTLDRAPGHVRMIDADGTNLHQLFSGDDAEQSPALRQSHAVPGRGEPSSTSRTRRASSSRLNGFCTNG